MAHFEFQARPREISRAARESAGRRDDVTPDVCVSGLIFA